MLYSVRKTEIVFSRADRRSRKTRTAIMDAGQHLFASRAMERVTVDDIVAAADIAKGSFYNHFQGKEELANAIVELVQGDCEFHIFSANREIQDAAMRIVRALCVCVNYAFVHPERLQSLINLSERRTIPGTPLNAGVSADIADGLAKNRFAGVTVETGVLIVLAVVRTLLFHLIVEQSRAESAQTAVEVGAALLRALGRPDPEATSLALTAAAELLNRPETITLDRLLPSIVEQKR